MDCALLLLTLWALAGSVSLQTPRVNEGSCAQRLLVDEKRKACPRPCKTDKDCGNKRQCLCDGQCGLSCVVPGRTCPWPLPPSDNSEARLLHPTSSFDALLEVRCKPGFTLPNGLDVTMRRCQGDRQWSGDVPVCTAQSDVFCQPPPEVKQGYVVAVQKTEYEVGFDIHYLCKKNFLLDGPQKVTCQPNGNWSAEPPHCRARCLIPAERSRVMIGGEKRWPFDVTDAMVPHGENVTFFCKHPHKHCSVTAVKSCFDGELQTPACYLEPTWLQFKLFPHRLVSELDGCDLVM